MSALDDQRAEIIDRNRNRRLANDAKATQGAEQRNKARQAAQEEQR